MAALPLELVAFTLTITTPPGTPISLYSILSTGVSPTGTSLGATLSSLFTGKNIAEVTIQNDPATTAGAVVWVGDSTLSATNKGYSLAVGASITLGPGRSNAWANGIYINSTTAASVLVNITVIYG